MSVLLIAANGAVAVASLLLVVACWNRRAVLAGLCSSAATTLAVPTIVRGRTPQTASITLIVALAALGIAAALLVLGEAIWQVLSDPADDDR